MKRQKYRARHRGVPGFGNAAHRLRTLAGRVQAAEEGWHAWASRPRLDLAPDENPERATKFIFHYLKHGRRWNRRRLRSSYHLDVRGWKLRHRPEAQSSALDQEFVEAILTYKHWDTLFSSMLGAFQLNIKTHGKPSDTIYPEMLSALSRCEAEELPLVYILTKYFLDNEGAVDSLAGFMATRLKSGPAFGSLHSPLVREHQEARGGLLIELPGEAALALAKVSSPTLMKATQEDRRKAWDEFSRCHAVAANAIRSRLGVSPHEVEAADLTGEAAVYVEPAFEAFIEREAIKALLGDAGLSQNERQIMEMMLHDPDAADAYGGNQRMADLTGRPANQIAQEKQRARAKISRIAGSR